MNTERRYDIDWLRVIAIGLLLIYHIAIIFQPWAVFIGFIRSNELMEGLWIPMTLLNVWRIPLLFLVSGMGVYFAMRKRNVLQLLLEKRKENPLALPIWNSSHNSFALLHFSRFLWTKVELLRTSSSPLVLREYCHLHFYSFPFVFLLVKKAGR